MLPDRRQQQGEVGRAVLAVAVHDHDRVGLAAAGDRAQPDGDRPLVAEIGGEPDDFDRFDARAARQRELGRVERLGRAVIDGINMKREAGPGEPLGYLGHQSGKRHPVIEDRGHDRNGCSHGMNCLVAPAQSNSDYLTKDEADRTTTRLANLPIAADRSAQAT